MNRKQKKAQINKLQNKCEVLKHQADENIKTISKQFAEKENLYLEHIQILQKRLMDNKHYVTETVCVEVAKDYPWMYESSRLPLSEIEKHMEQKPMDMMLRELSKRTDLLQKTEYSDRTRFYMEVIKLDDRPIPTLNIPRAYDMNPYEG